MESEVVRCLRELEEIQSMPDLEKKPAWLVMLGMEDWQMEISLIQAETPGERPDETPNPA